MSTRQRYLSTLRGILREFGIHDSRSDRRVAKARSAQRLRNADS